MVFLVPKKDVILQTYIFYFFLQIIMDIMPFDVFHEFFSALFDGHCLDFFFAEEDEMSITYVS